MGPTSVPFEPLTPLTPYPTSWIGFLLNLNPFCIDITVVLKSMQIFPIFTVDFWNLANHGFENLVEWYFYEKHHPKDTFWMNPTPPLGLHVGGLHKLTCAISCMHDFAWMNCTYICNPQVNILWGRTIPLQMKILVWIPLLVRTHIRRTGTQSFFPRRVDSRESCRIWLR